MCICAGLQTDGIGSGESGSVLCSTEPAHPEPAESWLCTATGTGSGETTAGDSGADAGFDLPAREALARADQAAMMLVVKAKSEPARRQGVGSLGCCSAAHTEDAVQAGQKAGRESVRQTGDH